MTHYLDDIVQRERKSRVKDALFAVVVAIITALALWTLATAIHGASTRVLLA